jgi:uncharacterized protein with beta-barrel porin domain
VQIGSLKTHLSSLSRESSGFASAGNNSAGRTPILLAYNGADMSAMLGALKVSNADLKNWNVFITGSGSVVDQETTFNGPGYNSTQEGTMLGFDCWVTDHFTVGMSSGYSHTDADLAGSGGRVEADSVPLWTFATWRDEGWYINAGAGYACNLYRNERNIRFPGIQRTAKSDPDGSELGTFIESGHQFHFGNWTFGPNASLQYTKLWIDGFDENGADSLNLRVGSQQAESLQSGAGARFTYQATICGMGVTPELAASWQREWANGNRDIEAHLAQGSSPFSVQTGTPERDFGTLSGGVTFQLPLNIRLHIGCLTDVGRSQFSTYSISSTLNVSF